MRFDAITIKDIANALGFSKSTVSRALRDSHEISPETKKLISAYAEEHNYRPNPIALSLKEKRSRSIGIVVCEIANSFFSQVINGIESIAYDCGYNAIISQTHESFEREIVGLNYLSSRSVDGLLISVSAETTSFSHLKSLHNKGLPIVFFDRVASDIKTHKVTVDNFTGSYDATTHLIENGFTRIASISLSQHSSITQGRLNGYKKALTDHYIPIDESLIRYCAHGGLFYEELEKEMNVLLNLKQRPQAIFASSDKITMGVLRYFKSTGIRVPNDIAVVGFSNSETTDLLQPALTVVRQPAFEMGKIATEMLINLMEAKRAVKVFENRVLPAELVVRDSSVKQMIELLNN
ncbi:LacI family DNA-binding transcriptional regulator [Pinibacter soli]|uniref:LacI family DNA-binding transcriptional regulator n=1 Tax=Pinibacter soli TaxID=3044211 RepID=A0ABT6RFG3_9BACT|nr:LacI family DNA-binding transcriptional regulator [Pinibacter soli]MDI3321171.1 LacI family DNA-binding transcriptional regulator [Pinibacter soli]